MKTRTLQFLGRKFRVAKASFDGGGQGQVFEAFNFETKAPAIYKRLDRPDDTDVEGRARLDYLIDQQVGLSLPQSCLPLAKYDRRGELGWTCTGFVPGA